MKSMFNGILVLGLLCLVLPSQAATLGFIDDFSAPGTNGWAGGTPVSNPGSGGVGGAGDGYLLLSNASPADFGTRSLNVNYQGNWVAAGITKVNFYLNDVNTPQAFSIHFLIADGGSTGTTWQYNTGFAPPNNAWQQYSVDMTDGTQWTRIIGTASFQSVLQNVNRVHFRHDLSPFGQTPDGIAGDLGIDNVALIPEPAAFSLLILGGLAFLRQRRS